MPEHFTVIGKTIDAINAHVKDAGTRTKIYRGMIDAMLEEGWDTRVPTDKKDYRATVREADIERGEG